MEGECDGGVSERASPRPCADLTLDAVAALEGGVQAGDWVGHGAPDSHRRTFNSSSGFCTCGVLDDSSIDGATRIVLH